MSEREAGSGKREAGSRKQAAGSFDVAIDRAVREMLDVEQPAGLRGRVLRQVTASGSQLPASGFRLPASGFRLPALGFGVAVAAALILAVLAPWRTHPPAPGRTAPPQVAANNPPVIAPPVRPPATGIESVTPARTVAPRRPASVAVASGVPSDRTVAAVAVGDEDTNFTRIAALEGPASIAPRELPEPPPSGLRSIEPAPMLVPALQVAALPETPQTRREE